MGNSAARHELEILYGKGCMFQKARIAERIEQMGGIKTYKTFVKETRYKRRKIHILENRMTYHHLEHESEGGKTDVLNGAVIGELPHRYLHSLPREQEEVINDMLREYKYNIGVGLILPTDKGLEIVQAEVLPISLDKEEELFTIPVYDNTQEDINRRYNRAKEKQDFLKLLEDELLDMDDGIEL